MRREQELRCFCSRHPLLAVCIYEGGRFFVHVKSWKGSRLYTELVITSGNVHIRCRECLRWHHVQFPKEDKSAKTVLTPLPAWVSV